MAGTMRIYINETETLKEAATWSAIRTEEWDKEKPGKWDRTARGQQNIKRTEILLDQISSSLLN